MRGAVVSVAAFGPLQVTTADRVLGPRDWGGRKPKQVCEILLVHQGQPVPKDRIAELLWGNGAPRDPMRTLEAYVCGVRARLGPGCAKEVLRTEPGGYRLDVEALELDLRRFDELLSKAGAAPAGQLRTRLRREALGLVRGEVLADEPYAEWSFPLRELYAERVLQLRLDLAEDLLAAAEPEEAAQQAEQVLAVQPGRERAHRLLVAARYAAGEQDLALRAYHRCQRVLDSELGVRPLAETEQIYLAVLRGAPVAAVLPAPRPPATRSPRPPQTRFARNGDTTIAYQVLGDGPLDVVFAHAWFSHMEIGWEEPRYAGFLRRLAQRRRLIIFDRRGMGMSDAAPATVGLRDRAEDIRAVMDAAGSSRAVVFGSCGSGPTAIALAAAARQRVCGLVLFGTFARMLAAPDYPCGWSSEFFTRYKDGLEQGWTTGRGLRRSVPSAGPDEALMEWLARLLRLSATPAAARAILDFGATLDVRDLLGRITCPTVILHRRDDQWVHPDNGRYLAAHIPGARLVELDGADHWPWFGDTDSILRPVEQFLDRFAPAAAGRFSEGPHATLPP
jgi:pimeloyl-ACP methyl ester carboxylesterase/DNA-binding SARP family transcriptional activator